ncbi:PAS domain-containing hybrid sensor histidine kinase/response regulator [Desulfovibrio litoralis]|uniref:PAS domain-containing hybrid sensor histidine kinase/response regulator n=1 Tax=Desulfovibrio litoralis TaxID=466107 RepID=UPI0015BED606|nr:PAS domain-containing hybrid sensor histidine kinase/response regulator [Desulfovibrio litoralis]
MANLIGGLDSGFYTAVAVPLLILRVDDFTVISTNKAFSDRYLKNNTDINGKSFEDVFMPSLEVIKNITEQIFYYKQKKSVLDLKNETVVGQTFFAATAFRQAVGCELLYLDPQDENIAVLQVIPKKSEIQKIEDSELFNLVLDSAFYPIFIKNAKSEFIFLNNYYRQLFGTQSQNLIGDTGLEFVSDEYAKQVREEEEKILSEAKVFNSEVWLTCSNGRRVLFNIKKQPLYDKNGNIIGIIGQAFDVTARRLEQEASAHEKSLLRTVIDAIPDVVFFKDRNYRYVGCNKAFEALFGVVEKDIVGKIDLDFLPPELVSSNMITDRQALSGAINIVAEDITLNFNNKNLVLEIIKTPYFSQEAQLLGLVCIGRDITMRKEAEEMTKEAQKIANDSNVAKSEFLANMSHEIRTPMNAIIGLAHLALNTELNQKQHDYINKIYNAGKSLLGIINDVLDFSKIEANKLEVENITFSLDNSFENISSLFGGKSNEKGVELIFDIDYDAPDALIGDPLRFGQILNNLVSNSVKFTEQGEIKVSCKVVKKEAESVTLDVSVSDSGIGMTEEQQRNIFTAFGQADASTTRKYGGTGLGLTITKRLVSMMGGTIRVDSEYKKGTTITCTLTFGIDSENVQPYYQNTLPDFKILLVDDVFASQEISVKFLSHLFSNIHTFNNKDVALAELKKVNAGELPYTLALVNLSKNSGDGLEFIKEIYNTDNIVTKPSIIFALSYGMDNIHIKVREEGVTSFLPKPFTRIQIYDAIKMAVDSVSESSLSNDKDLLIGLRPSFNNEKILLVEDNSINQQVATELLEEINLDVIVANNGEEALRILNENNTTFSLILMDLEMPVLDGYAATKQIRMQSTFDHIPIVAMTAHAMKDERDYCLAHGMNAHIAKPIEVECLYETIGKFIKSNKLDNKTGAYPEHATKSTLEELKGFDYKNALTRLGGNLQLFIKLLCQLKTNYINVSSDLQVALDKNDKVEVVRLSSSVKNLAGNIGATALYKNSEILVNESVKYNDSKEKKIPETLKTALSSFTHALQETLLNIKKSNICESFKTQQEKEDQEPSKNIEELKPQLLEFWQLLKDYDASVLELFSVLNSTLSMIDSKTAKEVKKAVERFEFEEALELFETLMKKADINLS